MGTPFSKIGITYKSNARKKIMRHWQLYLVILPPLIYLITFQYIPMFGAVIAFKDFNVMKGILGSPWVGLKYFELFFNAPQFWTIMKNTIGIGLYGLIVGFPAPILLALALNELRAGIFKKTVQMATFAPYFISTVVMVSMIMIAFNPRIGFINGLITFFGFESVNFLGNASYFWSIFVWTDVWQQTGYASIIYLAALAGVHPELYEAAKVDGASRIQRMINIDIPGLLPAAIIILILNMGNFMQIGFEKIFLLQNPLNMNAAEVIPTYVYKVGLLNANFSFGGAIGLFNSVINLVLLVTVNAIARKVSSTSLW